MTRSSARDPGGGGRSAPSLCSTVARGCEDLRRFGAVAPPSRLRLLRRLEVLVALEEVLDLVEQLSVHVADVANALEGRVVERHAQKLLAGAHLVAHVKDAQRPHPNPAA